MNFLLSFSGDMFVDILEGERDNDLQRKLQQAVWRAFQDAFVAPLAGKVLKVKKSGRAEFSTKSGPLGSPDFSISKIFEEGGFFVSHLQLQIDAEKGALEGVNAVSLGPDLDWTSPVTEFGARILLPKVEFKKMKAWDRLSVQLYSLRVGASYLPFQKTEASKCECPSRWLRPVQHWGGRGTIMNWMCAFCGRRYLCSCASGYVEKLCNRANYNNSIFECLAESVHYRDGICHLCRGLASEIQYRADMYGGPIYQMYFPYILQEATLHDLDNREGENRVRDRLGVPRIGEGWVNEMMLIRTVRYLFPELAVRHQASPSWLGRQRFDGYIEEWRVAIEYNGEQHYHPVARFGGEDALARTQGLDRKKLKLSREHGVEVVVFRYDERLSETLIFERLKHAFQRQADRKHLRENSETDQ